MESNPDGLVLTIAHLDRGGLTDFLTSLEQATHILEGSQEETVASILVLLQQVYDYAWARRSELESS
jgi:hypothetical protein